MKIFMMAILAFSIAWTVDGSAQSDAYRKKEFRWFTAGSTAGAVGDALTSVDNWLVAKYMDFDVRPDGKILFPKKAEPFGLSFNPDQDDTPNEHPDKVRAMDPKYWFWYDGGLAPAKKANLTIYSQISPYEGLFIEPTYWNNDPMRLTYSMVVSDENSALNSDWLFLNVDEEGKKPTRLFHWNDREAAQKDLLVGVTARAPYKIANAHTPGSSSAVSIDPTNPVGSMHKRATILEYYLPTKTAGVWEYDWDKILNERIKIYSLKDMSTMAFMRKMLHIKAMTELPGLALDTGVIKEAHHLDIEKAKNGADGWNVAHHISEERKKLLAKYNNGALSAEELKFYEDHLMEFRELLKTLDMWTNESVWVNPTAALENFLEKKTVTTTDGNSVTKPLWLTITGEMKNSVLRRMVGTSPNGEH